MPPLSQRDSICDKGNPPGLFKQLKHLKEGEHFWFYVFLCFKFLCPFRTLTMEPGRWTTSRMESSRVSHCCQIMMVKMRNGKDNNYAGTDCEPPLVMNGEDNNDAGGRLTS